MSTVFCKLGASQYPILLSHSMLNFLNFKNNFSESRSSRCLDKTVMLEYNNCNLTSHHNVFRFVHFCPLVFSPKTNLPKFQMCVFTTQMISSAQFIGFYSGIHTHTHTRSQLHQSQRTLPMFRLVTQPICSVRQSFSTTQRHSNDAPSRIITQMSRQENRQTSFHLPVLFWGFVMSRPHGCPTSPCPVLIRLGGGCPHRDGLAII